MADETELQACGSMQHMFEHCWYACCLLLIQQKDLARKKTKCTSKCVLMLMTQCIQPYFMLQQQSRAVLCPSEVNDVDDTKNG